MTILHVFYNTLKSSKYHFKDGSAAIFVSGVYRTAEEKKIKELQEEVAAGHPNIFIDPAKLTVDSADVDPIAVLKRKAVEEYLAAQTAASGDAKRDMGNTDKTVVVPASTEAVASVSAVGAGSATLANLAASIKK